MKNRISKHGLILLMLMCCSITSVPAFAQKKILVTEYEVREWTRQLQECEADQHAYKFLVLKNLALKDSLAIKNIDNDILAAEKTDLSRKVKIKNWVISGTLIILFGIIYLLFISRK
jgi:hypothetical protein